MTLWVTNCLATSPEVRRKYPRKPSRRRPLARRLRATNGSGTAKRRVGDRDTGASSRWMRCANLERLGGKLPGELTCGKLTTHVRAHVPCHWGLHDGMFNL